MGAVVRVFLQATLAMAVASLVTTTVQGQPVAAPSAPPVAGATALQPVPLTYSIHIPEGTELILRYNDHLSSATSSEGDRFSVTLDEPIVLGDGVTIPAGFRGVGEVTAAEHKGMMGKAGQLNVRLDYLTVGDHRIELRAAKGETGKDSIGATVALTVIF